MRIRRILLSAKFRCAKTFLQIPRARGELRSRALKLPRLGFSFGQDKDSPLVAVHADKIAVVELLGGVGTGDGGDAEIAGDDGAVRQDAAALDHQTERIEEQR